MQAQVYLHPTAEYCSTYITLCYSVPFFLSEKPLNLILTCMGHVPGSAMDRPQNGDILLLADYDTNPSKPRYYCTVSSE